MPRAKSICPKPGCPHVVVNRYCIEHEREYEAKRGNSSQRGYGSAHQRLRATLTGPHQAGTLTCWRCDQIIPPSEPFDLGHDDDDRTKYAGPEHARCNRVAAGRKAHI